MKTGKPFLIPTIIFFSGLSSLMAQTPVLEWARHNESATYASGPSITLDASGNIYITGSFQDSTDFDPGPGTFQLTSAGDSDIFIQKLDADGNLIWVNGMGGISSDFGMSIAMDASGNVYTVGNFWDTVDLDAGEDTALFTSVGEWDIFIQKLDSDGNFLWTKQFGSPFVDLGYSIAVDSSGNIHVTGEFQGTVDFDPGVDTVNLTSNGVRDIFILKLDTDGNFIWVKQMGGSNYDQGRSIALDESGNIYTTGYFRNTVDFNPGLETANLSSAGGIDTFVQKLNPDGDFLWAKRMGGLSHDVAKSIAVDASGNVYTTGRFMQTVEFDPDSELATYTSYGEWDIYVQKLDTDGNFIWARQMGGTDFEEPLMLALDSSGNVYTTGWFQQTAEFDPGEGTTSLTSAGGRDMFLQKLDTDGNFLWVHQIGGNGFDSGLALVLDASENIYVTGVFEETLDFEPGPGTTNLNASAHDVFFLKLSQCTSTMAPIPDETDLPDITAICEITYFDTPAPTASDACYGVISAYPNISFPITDQSLLEILWTFDNGYGNIVTQTQDIIWAPMDISTTLNGTEITANNANATYQWLDCDNNNMPLSGETNQSFMPTANGNYAVEITENTCVDTSACVTVLVVGLAENKRDIKLIIYPNPSAGIFNIEFEKEVDHAELTVTDIHGKLISATKIQNTARAQILLNQAAGIYLLGIKTPEGQNTIQLLKE